MTEDSSIPATLARIDERTKRTEHDVKQLIVGQNLFATKRELESLEKRYEAAVANASLRFEKIEDKSHKTIWAFAAGLAGLVGTYIFGKL